MTTTTRDEIESRLLSGESANSITADLGLDCYGPDGDPSPEDLVIIDGWHADDGEGGGYEVSAAATSGREAAQEYVDAGSWGDDPCSVDVMVWRVGIRAVDGEIVEERVDEDTITIDITIEEDCAIRRDLGGEVDRYTLDAIIECDHEWEPAQTGCDENPGVHSLGGTAICIDEVCARCGLERSTIHAGSQRNPGEASESVSYSMPVERES